MLTVTICGRAAFCLRESPRPWRLPPVHHRWLDVLLSKLNLPLGDGREGGNALSRLELRGPVLFNFPGRRVSVDSGVRPQTQSTGSLRVTAASTQSIHLALRGLRRLYPLSRAVAAKPYQLLPFCTVFAFPRLLSFVL